MPIPAGDTGWLNDFTLSITSQATSTTRTVLLGIWLAGVLGMIVLTAKSSLRLQNIKRSALPLQNPAIRRLYRHCLKELHITKEIPLYSTAFLQSPMITGFLRPRIYLPIHIISDYRETNRGAAHRNSCYSGTSGINGLRQVRYILLHELQHYRHKDALVGNLMTLTIILYWFNPSVWIALREMRNDREIACDTSVLHMLEPDSYADYGRTLINFAEKLSCPAFPFAAEFNRNMPLYGSLLTLPIKSTMPCSDWRPESSHRKIPSWSGTENDIHFRNGMPAKTCNPPWALP